MSTARDYGYRSSGGNRIYVDNISFTSTSAKVAVTISTDVYKSALLSPRNSDFRLFNDSTGVDTDYYTLKEGGGVSVDVAKDKGGILIYAQAQTASAGTPAILEIIYLA